jgi:translation elongation factor EF-4
LIALGFFRGYDPETNNIDQNRVKIEVVLPLSEIVTDFFDALKSLTSGYGSFDYEDAGYQVELLSSVLQILIVNPIKIS